MALATAPSPLAPTESPDVPPGQHGRRVVVIAAAIAVVLATIAVLWARRGAQEPSLDDAARRYHPAPTVTTGVPQLLTPAPGVYRYTGSGTEQLSLLQTQQQW